MKKITILFVLLFVFITTNAQLLRNIVISSANNSPVTVEIDGQVVNNRPVNPVIITGLNKKLLSSFGYYKQTKSGSKSIYTATIRNNLSSSKWV